jgi:hypothetical protein
VLSILPALEGCRCEGIYGVGHARRYSIEVRDAKSRTVLVSAAVQWTSDEKQIAVAQIFRLPGLAAGNGLTHRLSQQRIAKRDAAIAAKRPRKSRS